MPRVVVITPPGPVVSVDEAKAQVRVLADEEDALIARLLAASTADLDGPAGWLGRAIGMQTLEAKFDTLCALPSLDLPCPPIVEVSIVAYLDSDRIEQTVAAEDYELIDATVESIAATPPWTGGLARREALRVRYTAGYETVPEDIRHAIMLRAADMFAFRETVVTGTIATEVPMSTSVTNLLTKYRIW